MQTPTNSLAARRTAKLRKLVRGASLYLPTGLAALLLSADVGLASPASRALEANPTRGRVIELLGSSPLSCTQGIDRQVCTWRVSADAPAHSELARESASSSALHVVCDFPPSGNASDSATSTCTVHELPAPRVRQRRGPIVVASTTDAERTLREARTLAALSHALSRGPEDCIQRDESEWVCLWTAEPRQPGHAVLGALAGTAGAAELVCRLPIEGGERDADSCRAREAN